MEEFCLNNKIERANAYLFFYHFALKNKRWYIKAPYKIENIVDNMPNKIFDLDFYTNLENEDILSKAYLFEECFV